MHSLEQLLHSESQKKALSTSCASLVCTRTVESSSHQIVVLLFFRSNPVRKVRCKLQAEGSIGPKFDSGTLHFPHAHSTWLPVTYTPSLHHILQCGRE